MGRGAGYIIFQTSVVQWKDIRPWRPELVPELKHFVCGNSLFFTLGLDEQEAGAGGGRAAPYLLLISPKRRTCGKNPLVENV